MKRIKIIPLLLLITMLGGCGFSAGQKYLIARETYNGTVKLMIIGARAGTIDLDTAEKFEKVRKEVDHHLTKMKEAIIAGDKLGAKFIYNQVLDGLQRMDAMKGKAHTLRTDHEHGNSYRGYAGRARHRGNRWTYHRSRQRGRPGTHNRRIERVGRSHIQSQRRLAGRIGPPAGSITV